MSGFDETTIRAVGLERGELAGKTVVVTGGGRGIGREMAFAFAWLGASVVVAEISDEGLETERLIIEAGGDALFVRTDVSSEAGVGRLRRTTEETFSSASILVNNAIVCSVASVLDMDVAAWDKVMAVNLRGTFLTCKAFLPDMLARKHGTIVNMVSAEAMPYLSAYIASKQGIAAFSQSLAAEVGDAGVRVIPLAIGMVDTPGIRSVAQELAPHLGLSPGEFLKISLHPAYEGLMPADHAAVAVAYLSAMLADEYHGEIVDGYTLLERAGLIHASQVAVETTETPSAKPPDGSEGLQQALSLSIRLREMLVETEAEFDQLPAFVRPMARRGFKGKAGQSIQEWKRTMDLLAERLSRMVDSDVTAGATLRSSYPSLEVLLNRLIAYYESVPGETARFTRDTEMLRQVSEIATDRVASIRNLISSLKGVL